MNKSITVLPPVHRSLDTAYKIEDYPFGRQLRCSKYVWIDRHPKKGSRVVYQTTNPKKGNGTSLNAPKASTYSLAAALYIDNETGHLEQTYLSDYNTSDKARLWLNTYRAGLCPEDIADVEIAITMQMRIEDEIAANKHRAGIVYRALIHWFREACPADDYAAGLNLAKDYGYTMVKAEALETENPFFYLYKDGGAECRIHGADHDDLTCAWRTTRFEIGRGGLVPVGQDVPQDVIAFPWAMQLQGSQV